MRKSIICLNRLLKRQEKENGTKMLSKEISEDFQELIKIK